jgi:hypothetical protein
MWQDWLDCLAHLPSGKTGGELADPPVRVLVGV